MKKLNPVEILDAAIMRGLCDSGMCRGKPGAIIDRMGKEYREALQNLKSCDVQNIRTDYCYGGITYDNNQYMSKILTDFDKKLRK